MLYGGIARGIMTQTEEKQIAEKSESQVIASTAIRTLYWLFAFLALLLTVIRAAFPLAAMNVYADLGNTPRAYDCAFSAAKIYGGDAGVNARISCVNYSIALMSENPTGYAEAVKRDTEAFFADSGCTARIPLIDEYNVKNADKTMRPNLYSYADYISGENTRARFITGNESVSYFGKPVKYSDLASAITACVDSENNYRYATPLINGAAVVAEECKKAGKPLPFDEKAVTAAAKSYLIKALAGTDGDAPSLRSLYEIKAYQKYAQRLISGGFVTGAEKAAVETVTFGGTQTAINELYYNVLLKNYCK